MSHCAHDLTLEARGHQAEEDTLRAHTTVGFPALQFNTVTEQFVATRKMPERVMHNLPNLSQSTLQQTNMLLFAKLGIPCESTSNFFWRRQQNDDFRVGKNNSGDEFLTVLLAVNTEAVNRRAKAIARQDQAQFQSDYQGEQSLPDATKRTLYELRVHQIELEMQNEEVRRAHTELDIQRARYFDIYDNAPVGYCIVNDRELIVEANRTAATLLGVVRSELIQQPIFRFIQHDDRHVFHQMHRLLRLSGETQVCELQVLQHFGARAWVHLVASAAHDDDGNAMMRIVLSDMGEHNQPGIDFPKEKEFAEDLLETVREPLLILDSKLRIVSANCNFYQTFKILPAQTIGNVIYDIGDGQWNTPELRLLLEKIIPKSSVFEGYQIEHNFPDIGCRTILLNAREMSQQNARQKFILLAMEIGDCCDSQSPVDALNRLPRQVPMSSLERQVRNFL